MDGKRLRQKGGNPWRETLVPLISAILSSIVIRIYSRNRAEDEKGGGFQWLITSHTLYVRHSNFTVGQRVGCSFKVSYSTQVCDALNPQVSLSPSLLRLIMWVSESLEVSSVKLLQKKSPLGFQPLFPRSMTGLHLCSYISTHKCYDGFLHSFLEAAAVFTLLSFKSSPVLPYIEIAPGSKLLMLETSAVYSLYGRVRFDQCSFHKLFIVGSIISVGLRYIIRVYVTCALQVLSLLSQLMQHLTTKTPQLLHCSCIKEFNAILIWGFMCVTFYLLLGWMLYWGLIA